MNLVKLLERKRGKQNLKEFTKDLGISLRHWAYIKTGKRRIGGKTLMGILDKYGEDKDIKAAVWEYIDSYPRT
jgi:hypothetical protein